MRHNIMYAGFLACTALLLLLFGTFDAAANGTGELRKYLESRAGFDDIEILNMERGDLVSKLLPAEDKHEIAFCGVISIDATPQEGFAIFQTSLSRLDKKSIMAFGSFSDSPTIADLQSLTLEDGDIEALKTCRVGSCGVKLSAAMIKRFQVEVDWESPDYAEQATDLFRRVILEYVLDYRARGEDALIEYNNRPKALSLRSENDQLLKELGWVDNYAPEFFEYLQDPTAAPPPNTKKSIGWAKIRFGLKPVILLTEVITYTKNSSTEGDYLLSVTKQIYANHYIDSSVGLIVLLRDLESGSSGSSRLLYVNHSRSSALRGIFGKFMRKIVQREVMEKFNILLQNTANVAEHDGIGQDLAPPARTTLQRAGAWISEQPFLIALLILIVALITVNRFCRPITK